MPDTITTTVETITFQADGKDHVAAIAQPVRNPSPGRMTREVDGVTYAISIALGGIAGAPGVGYYAHPVVAG